MNLPAEYKLNTKGMLIKCTKNKHVLFQDVSPGLYVVWSALGKRSVKNLIEIK